VVRATLIGASARLTRYPRATEDDNDAICKAVLLEGIEVVSVVMLDDYQSIRGGIMNRNSTCAHRTFIRRLGPDDSRNRRDGN
jgi:hypothetical protein